MTATPVRLSTLSTLARSATLALLVRLANPSMLVQRPALPPPQRLESGLRSCTPRAPPTMRGSAGPLPSDAGYPPLQTHSSSSHPSGIDRVS
jgi:hypothetical protein